MSRENRALSFRGLRVNFSIEWPEAHLRHRVLLLCSPFLSGFHWRKILPELSELGCLCVLAELPGFGPGNAVSAPPRKSAVRSQMLWGVLDEVDARLGGGNALWHLAAHGAAWPTVLAMRAAQPDSVRSLIGISPLMPPRARGRFFGGRGDGGERILARALATPASFSQFVTRAARRPLPDYVVERMWAGFAHLGARDALAGMLDPADDVPAPADFCPSIAIWGGSDPLMPMDARERLAALVPDVEAHIIRPAGHFPMETHSRALRDYLRGWLKYVG